ncbi:MAG: alanine--tRNA ligase [Candidatus Sungbacteria bacterium]|nr:alanine--tRNA ligase [Candidatus Sungbacteria bacterium]
MQSSEIRKKFLEFFEARGHAVIASASLVPEGDNTTLFTGSGMQPLVKYLLGEQHPVGRRLVNSQKSFRTEDIDEVGDNRHDTFFEMLGNWSLGEYFKEEQLPWIFEFLTEVVGLDPQRIYVTVFAGDKENNIPRDDESVVIWQRLFKEKGIEARAVELVSEERGAQLGMQGGRIFSYQSKNWWSRAGSPAKMPAREPGGPDSEIFYEFANVAHDPKFGKHCHPNCDCGRFVEIGNSVFMEYKKNEDGTFSKPGQRNVDFGGGLERIVAASNNNPNIFTIDIFAPLISRIRAGASATNVRSEQIVADHVRASVFLISDGVTPSNKDRGYILRRLIRRAVTHGHYLIGLPTGFLSTLIDTMISSYKGAYPDLQQNRDMIREVFEKEQAAFERNYTSGIKEFEKVLEKGNTISGADAFTLLASHGFPLELTEELAGRAGKTVDHESFAKEAERHKKLSRAGSQAKFGGHGLYLKTGEVTIRDESEVEKVTRLHTATHLLHSGLRAILGSEVRQDGSDITVERTRFDFRFGRKVSPDELAKVEQWVNDAIQKDLSVQWAEMSYEEALAQGALGFFHEKYPPRVKVYTVFDSDTKETYSKEFCGGPHVTRTGEIGRFRIAKEESSSAGVRRIRAVIE